MHLYTRQLEEQEKEQSTASMTTDSQLTKMFIKTINDNSGGWPCDVGANSGMVSSQGLKDTTGNASCGGESRDSYEEEDDDDDDDADTATTCGGSNDDDADDDGGKFEEIAEEGAEGNSQV